MMVELQELKGFIICPKVLLDKLSGKQVTMGWKVLQDGSSLGTVQIINLQEQGLT